MARRRRRRGWAALVNQPRRTPRRIIVPQMRFTQKSYGHCRGRECGRGKESPAGGDTAYINGEHAEDFNGAWMPSRSVAAALEHAHFGVFHV